jgi:hypothetical protein
MTLSDLRQHILTRLGAPVINIELAPEQMDLYITDAVNKFIEVHFDGLDDGYIFLDVLAGTSSYVLPSNVHSVLKVMSASSKFLTDEPLLVNPYLVGNTTNISSDFSMVDYEIFSQQIAQAKYITGRCVMFEYNATTCTLNILGIPDKNERVALHIHSAPEDITQIYGNTWLKKYSTALCQIAWAQNISKYEGATLPGGISLNFQQILSEGKEAKEQLETELYERYQEPIDFMIG